MSGTRPVTITVELPEGIAEQAEELQPEILALILEYGIKRRLAYLRLLERPWEHQARILTENPHA